LDAPSWERWLVFAKPDPNGFNRQRIVDVLAVAAAAKIKRLLAVGFSIGKRLVGSFDLFEHFLQLFKTRIIQLLVVAIPDCQLNFDSYYVANFLIYVDRSITSIARIMNHGPSSDKTGFLTSLEEIQTLDASKFRICFEIKL